MVLCHATVTIVQQVKKKGFLTKKEKLHCLKFLFFILQDFKQNIRLESNGDTKRADNNRVFGSPFVVDYPE